MLPVVLVTLGAESTGLVNFLDSLGVAVWRTLAVSWILKEESIVGISSRVRLGLEKRIEVPERGLDVPISWHLSETHLHENLLELLSDLEQRVQVTTVQRSADGLIVVVLKLEVLPGSSTKHVTSDLGLKFDSLRSELGTLRDGVRLDGFDVEVLTLLVLGDKFLIVSISRRIVDEFLQVLLIHILDFLSSSDEALAFFLDPLLFHGLAAANFRDLGTDTLFHLWQLD